MHRNEVMLVGRLSMEPVGRELPSGTLLTQWRLAVRRPEDHPGRQRSDAIECATFDDEVRDMVAGWLVDDVIEVRGALRRRWWRGGSRYEVEVRTAQRVAREPDGPADQAEPADQNERADQNQRAGQNEPPHHNEQPDENERADQSERAGKKGQADQTERAESEEAQAAGRPRRGSRRRPVISLRRPRPAPDASPGVQGGSAAVDPDYRHGTPSADDAAG